MRWLLLTLALAACAPSEEEIIELRANVALHQAMIGHFERRADSIMRDPVIPLDSGIVLIRPLEDSIAIHGARLDLAERALRRALD